jgi:hypothetical protein
VCAVGCGFGVARRRRRAAGAGGGRTDVDCAPSGVQTRTLEQRRVRHPKNLKAKRTLRNRGWAPVDWRVPMDRKGLTPEGVSYRAAESAGGKIQRPQMQRRPVGHPPKRLPQGKLKSGRHTDSEVRPVQRRCHHPAIGGITQSSPENATDNSGRSCRIGL